MTCAQLVRGVSNEGCDILMQVFQLFGGEQSICHHDALESLPLRPELVATLLSNLSLFFQNFVDEVENANELKDFRWNMFRAHYAEICY